MNAVIKDKQLIILRKITNLASEGSGDSSALLCVRHEDLTLRQPA